MKRITFLVLSIAGLCFTAAAQADIHKIDFKNFTYQPYCAGEDTKSIHVKNGEYSKATQEDGFVDHFYFNIMDVTYGDVTGDGEDDAMILSVCNTGGTGNFTEGFVYTMKAGKPALLARVPGGDRADGGLRSITVENGLLVVEYNDPEKAAGACCPEGVAIQKMRVSGSKVIDVGSPIKRELYPKERIAFTKGTNGKTWTITIKPNDRKRYMLGARAGQTMAVSFTGEPDVDLRLLEDESAEVTQGQHRLDAVLKRSGDYTLEVSNYNDKPVTVSLSVRIR